MTKKTEIPRHVLKDLYINKRKSAYEISKHLKCDVNTIIARLKEYKIKCRDCSKAQKLRFMLKPHTHGMKGKVHSQEQKTKWSISRQGKQLGETNPAYKNGGRGMGYSTYRRYKSTSCFKCGSLKQLCVHHIDEDHYNNDPKNLMTLCVSCHAKLHRGAA